LLLLLALRPVANLPFPVEAVNLMMREVRHGY
jgi:hypothetical protein